MSYKDGKLLQETATDEKDILTAAADNDDDNDSGDDDAGSDGSCDDAGSDDENLDGSEGDTSIIEPEQKQNWPVLHWKTQISALVSAQSDQSPQCSFGVTKDPNRLQADSEDWADPKADLSLCWVHQTLCRFCGAPAQLILFGLMLLQLKSLVAE